MLSVYRVRVGTFFVTDFLCGLSVFASFPQKPRLLHSLSLVAVWQSVGYKILVVSSVPNSQIPQCTCPIFHNAPLRTKICTSLFWMMHCGIWDYIVGFVRLIYWLMLLIAWLTGITVNWGIPHLHWELLHCNASWAHITGGNFPHFIKATDSP